jgi:putative ABC transport system permease protein
VWILGKSFYFHLALTNIKRDKKMYLPYFLASTAFASIYFMVVTIMFSKGIKDVPQGQTLQTMFAFGKVIMDIITVIFMFYINSFLIKRRKKEFGLYGILGLEKRHVGRVIFWENFIISISSLVAGILCGCIFGKLIFLLIYYTMRVSANSRYILPLKAVEHTAALFFIIFLITFLYNLLHISLANPVNLLKSEHMGEKKVRFILIKTIIGAMLLGWAYYTAVTVHNALAALSQFFFAVIAVIAATYLLFQAGSLFILTFLRKRKRIFYKANNFVAISGLFYRMKQNATGLASICILSTMVLVTVSTCTSLYIGKEEVYKYSNPNDVSIDMPEEAKEEDLHKLNGWINDLIKKYHVSVEDQYSYDSYDDTLILDNGKLYSKNSANTNAILSSGEFEYRAWGVSVITIEEYNKICHKNKTLNPGEVLLLTGNYKNEVKINPKITRDFTIKAVVTDSKLVNGKNSVDDYRMFFVTANRQESLKLIKQLDSYETEFPYEKTIILNLKGDTDNLTEFSKEIRSAWFDHKLNISYFSSIFTDREEGYGIYGGLLFLGVFFTLLFLIATVLIIYFKQISEGYDDRERFVILQKVGMDDLEVKRAINKQILIVFFLPLVSALLHLTMAKHMIIKMLETFYLFNTGLTTWCMVITCFVFIIAYILVYRLTAKTYYKIVKW